jgi:hypothetical protein
VAEVTRLSAERDALRERISVLASRGKRVVADRDRWEAEAKRLASELSGLRSGSEQPRSGSDEKFKAAKRAFARVFHPNNAVDDGPGKSVRTEMFKRFWPILEDIEHGKAPGL